MSTPAAAEYLVLRLEAPLQAWGGVARAPHRPTGADPTRAGRGGLLASALGWTYADGRRTTALQRVLRYAAREDRQPQRLRDYHTVDLERVGRVGWTRHGIERRGGGAAATGTHVLEKTYLADAAFVVVVTLDLDAPVDLDDLERALRSPARPLFLGRRGCLPVCPVFGGRITATSPFQALQRWPVVPTARPRGYSGTVRLRCWYADGDGPDMGEPEVVWDLRDFESDRFTGSRVVRTYYVDAPTTGGERSA